MTRPKLIPKSWGMESWFVNEDYCGKRLTFAEDHRCSIHYHKEKNETFLVIVGRIQLELSNSTRILEVGDVVDLPKGVSHRMMAVGGNAAMIEFSTHHEDSDSYRIDTGQVWE